MLDLHLQHHVAPELAQPLSTYPDLASFIAEIDSITGAARPPEGLSDEVLSQIYKTICGTHPGRESPFASVYLYPPSANRRQNGDGEPTWPLTVYRYTNVEKESLRSRKQGVCSLAWLSKAFGVPPLPEIRRFAYCVRSEWAYEKVKAAATEGAKPLDPIEKAAVMEELYVCLMWTSVCNGGSQLWREHVGRGGFLMTAHHGDSSNDNRTTVASQTKSTANALR